MKVKLLKKVRKRFSIIHYPEGFRNGSYYFNNNLFKLEDNSSRYHSVYVETVYDLTKEDFGCEKFATEKACIDYLKGVILNRLRGEGFRSVKDKKLDKNNKKVWWVN